MNAFIAVILILLAGISLYLAQRLYRGLCVLMPRLRLWMVLIVTSALTLVLVLGFMRSGLLLSKAAKHFLGVISAYGMGIWLYLLLFTAAADVLGLLFFLFKAPFAWLRRFRGFAALGVLLLTAVTCVYGFVHAQQIKHVTYEVPLINKTDISDINMVLISDLHLGAVGSESRLERIVEEINALQPDVVCIAGDFFATDFEAIRDPQAALQTLQQLKAIHGVYVCPGNHDAGKTVAQMTDFWARANIRLLADEHTIIDGRLVLAGRLDAFPIGGFGNQSRQPWKEPFSDEALPVVVMDHNPANVHNYGSEVDLLLCGHTHRGQVFPANLITDSMYAVDHGYDPGDSQRPHVIVTSGVGTWGMPMRVGTDCEIVSIRFSPM